MTWRVRRLLAKPRAVAGLALDTIDKDTRLFELDGGRLQLGLVEAGREDRDEVQRFIANAYERVFGAILRSFYPSLISLHDSGRQLCGAAGARYAEGQALFLEQYLALPAHCAIEQRTGEPASRQGIVEIGNLSVLRPALTYPFMGMIGGWLQSYDIEWLVFALTHTLRRLFQRAGVELVDLGPAEPGRLVQADNDWGRYYEHEPRVTAVRLASGLNLFKLHHRGFGGTAGAVSIPGPLTCPA